jgi:ligand-binding SRPBCC domain-containing protein
MKILEFHSQMRVPRQIDEVFRFFGDALNLEQLTPPWLRFRVLTPAPIAMREGTEIEYKLKIRGFPARWKSKITAWEPPLRFVDEQVRGPYRVWIHEHRFTANAGGTLCEDYVKYSPLGGVLIDRLFVARDIKKIFEFRSRRLRELFGSALAQDE